MRRSLPPVLFTAIACLTFLVNASATTYYIAANGSDNNSGTSQSAPWAHLPGMRTWSGSHTPSAGDTFILRGCDVWGNANFPINWSGSGTSGSPITVTVDKTWFNTASCSQWNRPVFDAGNAAISGPWVTFNGNFVEFHWIEFRNYFWNNASPQIFLIGGGFDNITIDNAYVHHWTHGSSAVDTDNMLFKPNGSPAGRNSTLSNSVIDNTDGDGATCTTMIGGTTCSGGGVSVGFILNNVFRGMPTMAKGGVGSNGMQQIVGNYFCCAGEDIWSSQANHPNYIESIVGGGTLIIANNYMEINGIGEAMQVGNSNETDIIFNNVINVTGGSTCGNGGCNGPQVPQSGSSNWNYLFFNNTVANWVGCVILGGHGTSVVNYTFSNNHCINSGGTTEGGGLSPSGTVNRQNNLGMTMSAASSQGYTASENYAFAPPSGCTSSTCSTVGAGASIGSMFPAGFSTNDTQYGCSEKSVNGVVQSFCPARTTSARSGSWSIGAYEVSSGSSPSAPAPPTGLSATVN
ncbi:MAG TPA: hypothetical protein VFO39_03855 [Candidatus Sulfotelmatobacter sp.]|nr:hypothetical protein [Candidatus Sulfotelmatobacter sp.]